MKLVIVSFTFASLLYFWTKWLYSISLEKVMGGIKENIVLWWPHNLPSINLHLPNKQTICEWCVPTFVSAPSQFGNKIYFRISLDFVCVLNKMGRWLTQAVVLSDLRIFRVLFSSFFSSNRKNLFRILSFTPYFLWNFVRAQ